MNAKVLVVPNTLYTKVHADGTFRIENVPLGRRGASWPGAPRPSGRRRGST